MKFLFVILLFVHGLIHFMGFLKAFHYLEIPPLTQNISKPIGWLWLSAGLIFLIAAIFYLLESNLWFWLAIIGVVMSQILIIMVWQDSKFGSVANLIILVVAVIGAATSSFEKEYKTDVSQSFMTVNSSNEIISEKDIGTLPLPVQKYLRYVGVIGMPKAKNMKLVLNGKMREKGKDWFSFTSEQYNFFEQPIRLFFMKAIVNGLPTQGYHRYKDGSASMLIKPLSLIPVIDIHKPDMYKTETVTYFSELCLLAPSALIGQNIKWEVIDDYTVDVQFTTENTSVSARLFFNEIGELINFISEDRVEINSNRQIPFSMPVIKYGLINGYNLPIAIDAVWKFPEGDFVYGKFRVQDLNYNVSH